MGDREFKGFVDALPPIRVQSRNVRRIKIETLEEVKKDMERKLTELENNKRALVKEMKKQEGNFKKMLADQKRENANAIARQEEAAVQLKDEMEREQKKRD